MNLQKKKKLIARVLKVGIDRIKLDESMGEEIKEAITRQDIKDLVKSNLISIKMKRGRMKKIKRKTRRREGSKKKKVSKRKENYVKIIKKLRSYIKNLKNKGKLSRENYYELRKKIKSKTFKDISQLNNTIKGI